MTKQVVSPTEGSNHDLYYGTWTWENSWRSGLSFYSGEQLIAISKKLYPCIGQLFCMALYSDGVHYQCSADMYVPSLYATSPPCVTCNQRSINIKIIFNFTSANQKNTVVNIRHCSFSFTSRKIALNDYAFDCHLTATRLSYDCCILGGESLWTSNCGHSSHCGLGGCSSSRRWCGTSSTGLACVEEDVDPLLTVMIQSAVCGGWCGLHVESDDLVSSAWPRTWRWSSDCTARCPPCMTQIWLNGDYSGTTVF
jgi:hypothetical protein